MLHTFEIIFFQDTSIKPKERVVDSKKSKVRIVNNYIKYNY